MRATIVLVSLLAGLTAGTASAQRAQSVRGTQLELQLDNGRQFSAELLAAQRDSLWLLWPRKDFSVIPLSSVLAVRVPQGGLTRRGVVLWSVIGGLLSGAALTAACNSVEDADCGAVLPVVLLSWGIAGAIGVSATGPDTWPIDAETDALAPYARFPQGLPEGFTPKPGMNYKRLDLTRP